MIICGIKITHDGGVALIEDGELKFSIEMEKINNNPRYSGINDLDQIEEVLQSKGYSLEQIDRFVVDGWHGAGAHWRGTPVISCKSSGTDLNLPVAAYNERGLKEDIAERQTFRGGLPIKGKEYPYSSYMHVTGHVLGTYCASPFAEQKQSSYVLVWDGGQYPRLYYVDPDHKKVENLGHLFFLLGTIYSIIGLYFGPYKKTQAEMDAYRAELEENGFSNMFFGGLSIAGKIMSYIANGTVQNELLEALPKIHKEELEISNMFEHKFCRAIKKFVEGKGYSDADVLLTFHTYLQNQLIESLRKKLKAHSVEKSNFCFCGGSALNIKWNSAIRATNMFHDVFVPPFPNDSGSAIGAACAEMWDQTDRLHVDWSPYLGPAFINNEPIEGWQKADCSLDQLAEHIETTNEPVVFLNGCAEVGPRALGNRSILAAAAHPIMKEKLNEAKKREAFRPVAPICLLEYANEIFEPGCEDPYMLFDHKVRPEWVDKVPAICHLDGTARVQTVSKDDKGAEAIYELLNAYQRRTGIPLLCNTSANLNGSGFFPDVKSATEWGRVNYVWSNNVLYSKKSAA
ncbi:MAG: carbamoyltransferase N-terminal domain-containing protein [Bacteroidota bacterium]